MPTFSYDNTTEQDALIDRVEERADRVTPTTQSVGVNRGAVYEHLVDAMRQILNSAPRRAVDEASADGAGQAVTNAQHATEIELADDFMRFLNLKLADWERAVYETIDPRSDQHRLQHNTYTQADPYNPVAVKVARPTTSSGHALLCYPQDAGPSVDSFAYVNEQPPEDLPTDLRPALTFQAAGFVLQSDKEEGAEAAYTVARQLLQQVAEGQAPMVSEAMREVQQSE